MSRIPNSAIPHAWDENSEHAKEVRRTRGEADNRRPSWLKIGAAAAIAALAYGGFKLASERYRHA